MRSVVLKGSARCERCQLPLRWCICAAGQAIASTLQLDLLTHKRECHRPSSTGNLIYRLFTGSRRHVWHSDQPLREEQVVLPEREVWILHPNGRPVPEIADPATLQIILLDGSWSEASAMARQVGDWGRQVSLPQAALGGDSRFLLRAKQEGNRYSTAEALMSVLEVLGLQTARTALNLQFELHVYAGLRARGNVQAAAAFLATSGLRSALPEFLDGLHARRPLGD